MGMYRSEELCELGDQLQDWIESQCDAFEDDPPQVIVSCARYIAAIEVDDVTIWCSDYSDGDVTLDTLKEAWVSYCYSLRAFTLDGSVDDESLDDDDDDDDE